MSRRRTGALAVLGAAAITLPLALVVVPGSAGASSIDGLGSTIPADVIAASAAPGHHWTPEPERYDVGKKADLPITMADGTVLRADVYFPEIPGTKLQALGRFPVVLTQTPYGKGILGAGAGSGLGDETGPSTYLVKRGYIDVVADVRGTGDSGGKFGLFDPVQDTDGVTLVDWASKLPGSNGKVGLYGASYLGIDQLLTAGAEPKNSPLKAIFPVVPGNDLYKDTATMGGLIDLEFDAFYLALTGGLNTIGPIAEGLSNPSVLTQVLPNEIPHLEDLGTFDASFTAQTLSGGATAYDDAYWQARNPANVLAKVVANNIPAYMVGGEYDLFQRGEPLNYVALQNAWAGRPTSAAMLPNQAVTGRYQLLDGPYTHLSGSTVDTDPLMLEWFDTWLRGADTGMGETTTPLHYYDLGTNQFTEHAQYPFPEATATRYYFSPTHSGTAPLALSDHSLSTTPPTTSAVDPLLWSPVGNPCGRPSDQWSAGVPSLVTSYLKPGFPCVDGTDLLGQLGLDRAAYTTPPLTSAKTIAGPIDVTVYGKASTAETQWVAQIEDVSPDGTSTPLTEGALLGSLRAVSPAGTWTSNGQILQVAHTYSAASASPVKPGTLTRYDIEVYPTYATLPAGHRIRVTLSTADTPHLVPTLPELAKLLGGLYLVQMSPAAASAVEIPLMPAG